ncbi:glycosyltransferase [Mesorhizobium sp. M0751]|uniref:glycosyltransferase n=1 Tax=unclassified Mesorhizobium TaxID=325217 RepID=UPI003338DE56
MRIVQIVGSIDAEAAGPSYSVLQLARAIARTGNQVELMSLGEPSSTVEEGVKVSKFDRDFRGLPQLKKLGLSSGMKSKLVKIAPTAEILHTHGLWMMPNVYPAQIAKTHKVPFVVSTRGMLSPAALEYSKSIKSVFWVIAQRAAIEAASLIHATSEQEYEDIRAFGLRQPVVILPNGVGIHHWPARKRLDPPDRGLAVVLYLGRLHPIKRVETLIQAWAAIEDHFPHWKLEIRGPGEPNYVRKLTQEAVGLGLKRCTFGDAAYGDQKHELYRRAGLFVLPSSSENFAMTVAESLACGTPVITTKATPWRGLETNQCGWWIDHGVEPLKKALDAALSIGTEELNAMGARGQGWMMRDFAWAEIGDRMLEAYRWIRDEGSVPSTIVF